MIRKAMELSFSKSAPLPYAVVATNLLVKKSNLTLKVVESSIAPGTTPIDTISLTIDSKKVHGQSTILRYLARLGSSSSSASVLGLYPETMKSTLVASLVDQWLDWARVEDAPALVRRIQEAHGSSASSSSSSSSGSSLVAGSPAPVTLADLAVWGVLRSQAKFPTSKPFSLPSATATDSYANWFQRMDTLPECQQAIKIVDDMLGASAPATLAPTSAPATKKTPASNGHPTILNGNVLDIFRQHIGKVLEPLVPGFDAATLASYLELPRGSVAVEFADICIPVPRLRIKGNTQEVTLELSKKVFSTFHVQI